MTATLAERSSSQRISYTVPETAVKTGLSEKTIHRRIADGSLKARKLGRRWLVSAASVEALG